MKYEKDQNKSLEAKGKLGEIIGMKIIEGAEIDLGEPVRSCHINSDGTLAIVGSSGNKVRLAEIKRNELGKVVSMEIINGTEIGKGDGCVQACKISNDSTFAIFGASDETEHGYIHRIYLAEIKKNERGKVVGMEKVKNAAIEIEAPVLSCCINPSDTFAIIGSGIDNKVRLIEIKKNKQGKAIGIKKIKNTEINIGGWCGECDINSNNTFAIISSGTDDSYDDANKVCLAEIRKNRKGKIISMKIIPNTEIKFKNRVSSCDLSFNNTFAIIGSGYQKINLAEITTNKQNKLPSIKLIDNEIERENSSPISCHISPDETFAIVSSDNDYSHKINLMKIKRDEQKKPTGLEIIKNTEIEVGGFVHSCQISPDNTFAIIGSLDNKVRLVEITRELTKS